MLALPFVYFTGAGSALGWHEAARKLNTVTCLRDWQPLPSIANSTPPQLAAHVQRLTDQEIESCR